MHLNARLVLSSDYLIYSLISHPEVFSKTIL